MYWSSENSFPGVNTLAVGDLAADLLLADKGCSRRVGEWEKSLYGDKAPGSTSVLQKTF